MNLWHKTFSNGKPPLVLLHGWGFSADIFTPLLETLGKQYELTLIDLPGHGRSQLIYLAGKQTYLQAWTEAIAPLIAQHSTIIGWSLGGLVGIKLAKLIPVKRLILLASTPCFVNNNTWNYGIDPHNFTQFSHALNQHQFNGLKNFVRLQAVGKNQLKSIEQSIKKYPTHLEALNQGLDILLTSDLRQNIKQLNTTTEVILGTKDTLVNAKISSWFEMNQIKCTQLSGGHLPFLHPNFQL